MSRISRRSVVGGALLVPFAGLGLRGVMANQSSTPEATPGASPAASPGASPMASPAAGGDEIMVTAVDIDFVEEELTIPADTDVTVTLTNEGVLQHDWYVEEFDVGTELLNGGETGSVVVNMPAGEYEYICTVPGHAEAGMVGTLIVE